MTTPSPNSRDPQVEAVCVVMHDAYEAAAVGAGWETQAASRKPWASVPEANKTTMRAAVGAVLDHWLVLDLKDDEMVERISEVAEQWVDSIAFLSVDDEPSQRYSQLHDFARDILAALANPGGTE